MKRPSKKVRDESRRLFAHVRLEATRLADVIDPDRRGLIDGPGHGLLGELTALYQVANHGLSLLNREEP